MVRNVPGGRLSKSLTLLLPVKCGIGEGFGFLKTPNIFTGFFALWNHFWELILSPPPLPIIKKTFFDK